MNNAEPGNYKQCLGEFSREFKRNEKMKNVTPGETLLPDVMLPSLGNSSC